MKLAWALSAEEACWKCDALLGITIEVDPVEIRYAKFDSLQDAEKRAKEALLKAKLAHEESCITS